MSVTETVIAASRGARLVQVTTRRRFRKPLSHIRCECPFLCDAASEPCEFDLLNRARAACKDQYTIGTNTP